MTSRNRETLRSYFGDGMRPSRDHFADLVDSMLNMTDEGFRKTPDHGLEISTPIGHDGLLSFYRDQNPKQALWSVSYGGTSDQLLVRRTAVNEQEESAALLTLDPGGHVGINHGAPQHALDVGGTACMEGRIGRRPDSTTTPLPADGQWHDLTEVLTGCQAFEVMAGVGNVGTGHFALLHAFALNTFNPRPGLLEWLVPRKRIRSHQAHYGRLLDRLQLRWNGSSGRGASYRLQIRTRSDYGAQIHIQCYLTRLWFDAQMQESQS
jgi:hypothetical protein